MEPYRTQDIKENGYDNNYRFDTKEFPKKCIANVVNVNKVPELPAQNRRALLEKILKKASNLNFHFCANISKYEKLAKIGQGTFGEVFKARDRKTQQFVALKKILMENEREGFPITALREIKILHQLKHENIVNLIEVCQSSETTPYNRFCKPTFYLIFDFCEHDLAGLLNNSNVKFNLAEIKMIMKQLLHGLFFMHCNKILHRDMKAANILITKEGVLKIADFGLSRPFRIPNQNQPNRLTNRVVTLWYRPPELLLGDRNYGPPIDMWGAGCIMAEMWTRVPILQGTNEQHQIKLITELCGSITPESLPNADKLELYSKIILPSGLKRKVKERLRAHVKDEDALQLIDMLLTISPAGRVDADSALSHDFFYNDPLPCEIDRLLAGISKSQFEYNRKRNVQSVVAPPQPRRNDDQYYDPVY